MPVVFNNHDWITITWEFVKCYIYWQCKKANKRNAKI